MFPLSVSAEWLQNSNNSWSWIENGDKTTGWKQVNGTWYHFNTEGDMQTGWVRAEDSEWYYMNADGSMRTGWLQTSDGKWYKLDSNGSMKKGWVQEESNGKWYRLSSSGELRTGWIQESDGKWYFSDSSGAMQTGIIQVEGKSYALAENGAMLIGKDVVTEGQTYTTDDTGVITLGNVSSDNKKFDNAGVPINVSSSSGTNSTTSTSDTTTTIPSMTSNENSSHHSSSSSSNTILDKLPITNAIAEANAAKLGVVISADGSDVVKTSNWVNQEVSNALEAAIEAATNAKNNVTTKQEVNNVVKALNLAISTYRSAKAFGTKVEHIDTTSIDNAVANANAAKSGVSISVDGSDVVTTSKWVTQEVNDALESAIEGATDAKNNVTTEEEVNQAVEALNSAILTYRNAKASGTKVEHIDTTSIDNAVANANAAKSGVSISVDGSDVVTTSKWVTQEVNDALESAIESATDAKNNITTEEEVNQAVEALNSAISTYKNAKASGTKVEHIDTTSIDNAVANANAVKSGVSISIDGSDVVTTSKWVTQEVNDALESAIEAATDAKNNVTTEEEVNQAVEALNSAISTYKNAKASGTKVEHIDTTSIDNAVANANAAKSGVSISVDGSDVVTTSKWVTQEVNDALESAIEAATDAKNNVTTEEEVNQAVEALNSAISTYKNAKASGTKVEHIDTTSIDNAVANANAAKSGVSISVDGSDVVTTSKWVTQEVNDALESAIEAATDAKNNVTTEEEVNQAVEALNSAILTYKNAKASGTKVEHIDTTSIDNAVANANAVKSGVSISVDGSDVVTTSKWVTQEVNDALESAIEAATDAKNNVTTEEEVNQAVEALNSAISTYKNAKASGTKVEHIDTTSIDNAVANANAVKSGVSISVDGSDVVTTSKWVTQEVNDALESAIEAATDAKNNVTTEEEVNQAVEALNSAISTYKNAKASGTKVEHIDTTSIDNAVANANAAKSGVSISVDGSDVVTTSKWVTQEVNDALESAIEAATDAKNNVTTEEEVNQAVEALNSAILTYKNAKASGTKVEHIDTTSIDNAVANANAVKSGVSISVDGSDVVTTSKWVTQEVNDALESAIEAATDAKNNVTTEEEVNQAVEALNSAISTYKNAKASGTKVEHIDTTSIDNAVANANAVKSGVSISVDGSDVVTTSKWVTQEVNDALESAIEAATDAKNNVTTEEEVNQAVEALNSAISTYKNAKASGTKVEHIDTTSIDNAVANANAAKSGVSISVDGSDVVTTSKWVTQEVNDALESAIEAATDAKNNVTTEEEVNQAVEALNSAILTYKNAKASGTKVEHIDTTSIDNAVANANAVKSGVSISVDGSDVVTTSKWVTQEVNDALESAIEAATDAKNNVTTEEEVNQAVEALNSAISTYKNAKASGTKVEHIDTTSIDNAVANANAAKSGVSISVDGSDVVTTSKWVTQEVNDALESAIEAATDAKNNVTTEEEVNQAVEALNSAISTYKNAKASGTKVEHIDTTSIDNAVANANAAKSGVSISVDGSDVVTTSKWVTQEVNDALESAIEAATDAKNNVTTEEEVNQAVEALNSAILTYKNAKASGTKVEHIDTTSIDNAVANANAAKSGVSISVDGSDVVTTSKWVTQEVNDALESAIEAATDAKNNVTTEEEVNQAVEALNSAISTYKNAKASGTKVEHIDTTSIDNAVANANAAKSGVSISVDGSDVVTTSKWVTQEVNDALESAIEAATDAKNNVTTEEEVNQAVEALNSAILTYKNAKASGTKVEHIDTTSIDNAVANANAVKSGVSISVDGSDVVTTSKWVTQEVNDALESAINKAANAKVTVSTDQEVADTVNELSLAISAYNQAKAYGTKVVGPDKTPLNSAIDNARATKIGIIISADGTDVDPQYQWVNQSINNFLDYHIMNAIMNERFLLTQQQVNDEADRLNSAITLYNQAKAHGTKVARPDTTAIDNAIDSANMANIGVTISTNGADVDPQDMWVTQEVNDALEYAINKAANAKATVSTDQEVADTVNELNLAISAYNQAKAYGTKVIRPDTTAIDNAIDSANMANIGVTISTNGADVDPQDMWVTQEVSDALESAINKAANAKATVSTDQEVADTVNELSLAISAYNQAKAYGTKVVGPDKTPLNSAIDNARATKIGIIISADGTDVDPQYQWVNQSINNFLDYHIMNAIMNERFLLTQQQVNDEADRLNSAITLYNQAKAHGTKVARPDTTAIDNAIDSANMANIGVTISTNGADVDPQDMWVTQEVNDALEYAINKAANAKATVSTDQEVADTVNELNLVISAYNQAKAYGTKVIRPDTTAIDNAIDSANMANIGVTISTNGADVDPQDMWVTQEVSDALESAINKAANAKATVSTDQEVADTVNELNLAISAYNQAKAYGTKVEHIDTTLIDIAITAANTAKNGVIISNDGTDADPQDMWVTQEVSDALESAINKAANAKATVATGQQVADAANELNYAVLTYNQAKSQGKKVNNAILGERVYFEESLRYINYVIVIEGSQNLQNDSVFNTDKFILSDGNNHTINLSRYEKSLNPGINGGYWYDYTQNQLQIYISDSDCRMIEEIFSQGNIYLMATKGWNVTNDGVEALASTSSINIDLDIHVLP
nr:hypothetical protein [Clostridium beijerinckii]